MTHADVEFARAIRLGRLVPREIVHEVIRYVEAPKPAPIPEPKIEAPSNVIVAPIPVTRPYLVFRYTPTAEDVLNIASEFYATSITDIKSDRRTAIVVRPRQVTMYLMKLLTLLSLPAIGRAVGNRDHTTVLHAVRKIEGLVETDDRLRDEIDLLKIKISALMGIRNAGTPEVAHD